MTAKRDCSFLTLDGSCTKSHRNWSNREEKSTCRTWQKTPLSCSKRNTISFLVWQCASWFQLWCTPLLLELHFGQDFSYHSLYMHQCSTPHGAWIQSATFSEQDLTTQKSNPETISLFHWSQQDKVTTTGITNTHHAGEHPKTTGGWSTSLRDW